MTDKCIITQDDRNTFLLQVRDVAHTARIGQALGKQCSPGDVLLLSGDLGAGKTTVTQSIAVGMEVSPDQYVTSPSFALMHEYRGRLPLYHMDFYRLAGEDDVEGAGLLEYIGGSGVAVIEWADRMGSLCPQNRLEIKITCTGETERLYTFIPYGASWLKRISCLFTEEFSD
ncbi:MAG: tRNA (adenosine(37)-N6)-threonylcarbamoyltransferase complex ATPase subunit type 1 TsaE [Desulfobulbus sp.]|nr:MAG: tRNA (adenosine(37)-N6)-threonylcarbamoyltransferase complex ATPase subunit type 1 TsaE [Desulfobulbus sp.]